MLPSSIRCEECHKSYNFPDDSRGLYLYAKEYGREKKIVKEDSLIAIPKKPIWCGVCNKPVFAEDLRRIVDWEGAFSLIKSGQSVEYPIDNTFLDDKTSILDEFKILFEIRQKRQDRGRCLFCGGLQYVEIGNPDTGIKHEGCGGVFVRLYSLHSAVYALSGYRVYSVNGMQIGRLKKYGDEEGVIFVSERGYR
ncbi:MAG: hypothetical protein OEZ58_20970 [Gammaproteobacteria bacterium]|nr:hypothetical protein [Gammaproteobacteria bacterium]